MFFFRPDLPVFAEPFELVLLEGDGVLALFDADTDVIRRRILDGLDQLLPTLQRKAVLQRNKYRRPIEI